MSNVAKLMSGAAAVATVAGGMALSAGVANASGVEFSQPVDRDAISRMCRNPVIGTTVSGIASSHFSCSCFTDENDQSIRYFLRFSGEELVDAEEQSCEWVAPDGEDNDDQPNNPPGTQSPPPPPPSNQKTESSLGNGNNNGGETELNFLDEQYIPDLMKEPVQLASGSARFMQTFDIG